MEVLCCWRALRRAVADSTAGRCPTSMLRFDAAVGEGVKRRDRCAHLRGDFVGGVHMFLLVLCMCMYVCMCACTCMCVENH
jgi:hypothetical protein